MLIELHSLLDKFLISLQTQLKDDYFSNYTISCSGFILIPRVMLLIQLKVQLTNQIIWPDQTIAHYLLIDKIQKLASSGLIW